MAEANQCELESDEAQARVWDLVVDQAAEEGNASKAAALLDLLAACDVTAGQGSVVLALALGHLLGQAPECLEAKAHFAALSRLLRDLVVESWRRRPGAEGRPGTA